MNRHEPHLQKSSLSVTGYALCFPVREPFSCVSPYIAFAIACASRYAGRAYAGTSEYKERPGGLCFPVRRTHIEAALYRNI